MAAHDALLRDLVTSHSGRVVKSTGDGVHAVFDDAALALRAALHIQQVLADPANTAGFGLKVRCGLHGGDDEVRDGDFYGPAVNRAARIMSAAHGGQTLLSQVVVDAIGNRLPPDTGWKDLGRVRLRDLAQPERVYQMLHPGVRAEFPALRSLEATPNNLARQLDSFVGRERELSEAKERLSKSRLLTLVGMGGMGKSRLSVQLAAEVMDDYPDGVWMVELAALSDPRLVPQAMATAVGVREEAGLAVAESLIRHVRDKQLLFVLDNCEHMIGACADMAKQVLQAAAGVKVVASSRDVLRVAGEATYQVPTMSVPDARHAITPDEITKHEAVRLFVDRASAAQPTFKLTRENAAAVADICSQLDGIPLAIELAAARIRVLSVQLIAQRLSDRFKLLTTRDETVLPRQRTLRALIDWSHDLLPDRERVLFRRLAVFAGGWTLGAAESVCADDVLPSEEILDLLAALVEKSLVVLDRDSSHYRMLDTVRHYAQGHFETSADIAEIRRRHFSYFVGRAEEARSHLVGPEQGRWLAVIDSEHENHLAAHTWSQQAADFDLLALRQVHALRPYWIVRGHLSIGLRLLSETLARETLQQRDQARCMALFGVGQLSYLMGRHEDARRTLMECLSIAREIDDASIVARVLQPLGSNSLALRDFAAAKVFLGEALELAREIGNQRETACALIACAMTCRMQNELTEATSILHEAVALARELGDQEVIGICLLNLAMVLTGQGEIAGLGALLKEAGELAQETGSYTLNQGAMEVCCGVAAALHQWDDAAYFYGAAEAQREDAGRRREPGDEAFLLPLVARSRTALSAKQFTRQEALGRGASRQERLQKLQSLLQAPT